MHRHRAGTTAHRRRLPMVVGVLATLGLVGASSLLWGGTANASAPKKNYHPGKDTATFTVTGVLDANCLVSVGGNKIYIKPGDAIAFKSSAVGVSVNLAGGLLGSVTKTLTGSQLAGLNVSAYIDKGTSRQRHFTVAAGATTTLTGLSSGTHSLAWSASSVKVLPSLGGVTVPMSSAQLKSGAKLSWAGGVYVSSGAPDCRLAVSTPKTDISAGPVHVSVPGQNVTLPVDPNKIAGKIKSTVKGVAKAATAKPATGKPATTNSGGGGTVNAANGPLPVPARVVPGGYGSTEYGSGGSGAFANSSTLTGAGSGGYAALKMTSPDGKTTIVGSNAADQQPANTASAKKSSSAAQLPIVLAIIAIVALALVGSTYARLFLLRRRA